MAICKHPTIEEPGYRALGVSVENGVTWFWIGTHAEYDRLIA